LEASFAYICEFGAKELNFIALSPLISKINKLKDIVDVAVYAYGVANS
jgi:hypothetical protein